MKKVLVYLEEVLCREIAVEIEDDELTVEERIELAENKVKEMYKNKEIVLTLDNRIVSRISSLDEITEEGSDWEEIEEN